MMFFVAFLPQFLGVANNAFLQLLMLGLIFQVVGLVGDLTVGWTAAVPRDKVLARPRAPGHDLRLGRRLRGSRPHREH
jgi:threonine/homoserine/homoserine lactone efflux protein